MTPREFADMIEDSGRFSALELSADEDEVTIEALIVQPPRRAGVGTALLQELCILADREAVVLTVKPMPLTILIDNPIPQADLQRFYARHGFRPAENGVWKRKSPPQEGPFPEGNRGVTV